MLARNHRHRSGENALYAGSEPDQGAAGKCLGSMTRQFGSFRGCDRICGHMHTCILQLLSGRKAGKLSVWICYSSLAVLVAFGIMKCYWIILLVPFMVLLLFMERHNTRINFILEAFAPLLTVSIYVITQSQVYGGRLTFDYLIFPPAAI